MSFEADNVHYSIGGKALLQGVSLRVLPGRVHALLGANGAGKSTLLRLFARELRPTAGSLHLNGRPLHGWDAQALARQRAVLPQSESLRFGFTVEQVVALGRLPALRQGAEREAALIDEALHSTDALHLKQRIYPTLSGGERQRVQLARVLAQIHDDAEGGPRYLLLDEPTASLDLKHQHSTLRLARVLAARGIGVLAVLHDPNLALRYADDISLLQDGRGLSSGPAADLICAQLEAAFGIELSLVTVAGRRHLLTP